MRTLTASQIKALDNIARNGDAISVTMASYKALLRRGLIEVEKRPEMEISAYWAPRVLLTEAGRKALGK